MININTAQALEGRMKNKITLIHIESNLASYCHFIFSYFSCNYATDIAKLDHTTTIKQWMTQNVNINAKVNVALSILKRPKTN
jgi:hypothetical protein